MKVTFVGIGTEQLGVSQLSAILKEQGYTVNLAFSASLFHDRYNIEIPSIAPYFDDTKEVYKAIEDQQPDVIAFSPLTSTFQWMLQVARKAKELNPNVITIFGGVHTSALPDLVINKPEVDYAVTGEGDVAMPSILKAIEQKDFDSPIYNTRFKNPKGEVVVGLNKGFYQDLDNLPFYDKILWEDHIRIGDMYLTMATRGCPFRCTFCFNNFFAKLPEEKQKGKYVRMRGVDHMLAELKFAKQRYNLKSVDFNDDVFTTNKKWLQEFLPKYKKEIGVPFSALTHPKYIDDDIAKWLKEAGCEWLQMGVQSMDEQFKKDNLMRYEKSDQVNKALDAMLKNGISAKIDHMLGLPNEPIEAQETAVALYKKHTPQRIQTFWTCYLPGTQMMNEAIEDGSLSKEQADKINEGHDFYFFRNTDNIEDPEMADAYKKYELIYRVLPVLPVFLKKWFTIKTLKYFPAFLSRPLSIFADIFNALVHGVPEFYAYYHHNAFHLKRFFGRKLGFKNMKASKIKNAAATNPKQFLTPKEEELVPLPKVNSKVRA